MKRLKAKALLLTALLLALSLVACVGEGNGETDFTGSDTRAEELSTELVPSETESAGEREPAADGFPNEAESGGTKRY